MTEHDLRNLLIEYETSDASVHPMRRSAGGHGKWLVRILTAITILLWIAAVTLLGAFFVGTFDWLTHHVRTNRAPTESDIQAALFFMAVITAALFAALLSTVIRAYVSWLWRLRRINASLFELFGKLLEQQRSDVKRERQD